MVFSSLIFLFVFLPITLVLYYIVPKPLKNPVLILCSLIFYAWETPQYLVLMLFSVVFNYCAGLELDDLHGQGKAKAAKWFMIAVAAMNLFLLGFFKYSGFLVENLNHIPGVALTAAKVALPVGISFYTFQVLSYVFDVYRQNVPVQRNFVLFATYVTFFPKLVSGPIVAYKDMEAQLRERQVSLDRICSGATLFLTGLFKKVLIADNLGVLYAGISGQSGAMSVVTAWLGAIGYTLQLYFDFSGYSDMAIGLGQMFGFDIDKNFDYPYLSKSITEFWRRWHISLGKWFRDYVYFPLGGSRVRTSKILRNLLIVWLLTGIWHGAAWTFVFWGLLHGLAQVLEKFPLRNVREKVPDWVNWLVTMLIVNFGWVFFAAPSLGSALHWIGQMFYSAAGFLDGTALYYLGSSWPLLLIAIIGCTPWPKLVGANFAGSKGVGTKVVSVAVYALLLVSCVASMINATYSTFLYFQF